MYLTCVELDLSKLEVLRILSSPYRIHAIVESSIPSEAIREDQYCRVLWRLDGESVEDVARLYIVSPDIPAAEEIAYRFGADGCRSIQSKDYLPFTQKIMNDTVWRFRLRANPVRKVRVDKGRRPNEKVIGKLQGHVTAEQQLLWLLRQADKHGFRIEGLGGNPDVIISHRLRQTFNRGERKVTLSTAQFDGVLCVEDELEFRRALGFGIGRAKGFGCGLMTVVPL